MNNSNDDPFFAATGDRTIIRPVPGGKAADLRRHTEPVFQEPGGQPVALGHLSKLNPLDNAASPLLALVTSLYNKPSHPAPDKLKQQLVNEVKAFEANANHANLDQDIIQKARYVLCTTIDEAVFHTPWGRQSGWAEHSLLSNFHGEVSGGQRFFQLLQEAGRNPKHNLYLLELMYTCLSLGFQGRYRLESDGKEKITQIRSWLANLIRSNKPTVVQQLSPHWRGIDNRATGLIQAIPLWVFFSIASVLLLLLFMALLFSLTVKASPVYGNIQALDMEAKIPAAPVENKINQTALLETELVKEINQELVSISANGAIEIRGDKGLFASGSDKLLDEKIPLIEKISDILAKSPFSQQSFKIIGHTDNIPTRPSLRFPSNWELSKARAEAVKKRMQSRQPNLSLLTDGKAETDPVSDNSNPAGRARNRRVEITKD